MDTRFKRNITYIMIYAAGVLSGLSFVWKYPLAYSLLMFILAAGFIMHLNDIMFKNGKNTEKVVIQVKCKK